VAPSLLVLSKKKGKRAMKFSLRRRQFWMSTPLAQKSLAMPSCRPATGTERWSCVACYPRPWAFVFLSVSHSAWSRCPPLANHRLGPTNRGRNLQLVPQSQKRLDSSARCRDDVRGQMQRSNDDHKEDNRARLGDGKSKRSQCNKLSTSSGNVLRQQSTANSPPR
jgi:hypothetical protein